MGLLKPNIAKLFNAGDSQGLLKALRNKDSDIREAAVAALGGFGDPSAADPSAVDPLLTVMNGDPDAKVRGRAAVALAIIGDQRAVEPICDALAAERIDASWAAPALGALGDRRAVGPLCDALERLELERQEHRAEREARGNALPSVDENIQQIYDIGDKATCTKVAAALGQLGDKQAIEPLGTLLDHKSVEVRMEAKAALKQIGGRKADKLVAAHEPSLADRLPPTSDSKFDHLGRVCARSDDEAEYRRLAEQAGFSKKEIEQGAVIRYWYPHYTADSQFIYHTRDLFDSELKLIGQKTDPEERG